MIFSKEVKIKKNDEFLSEYIESELNKLQLDILSWAIVGYSDNEYIINIAVIQNP